MLKRISTTHCVVPLSGALCQPALSRPAAGAGSVYPVFGPDAKQEIGGLMP